MVNRGGARTVFGPVRSWLFGALLLLGCGLLLKHDASLPQSSHLTPPNQAQVLSAFGKLPINFEPNQGQADGRVKFLAHGAGYGLYLAPKAALLSFPKRAKGAHGEAAIEMQLAGANENSHLFGTDRQSAYSNYFIGNDPTRWLHKIPQFGRVRYHDIYPGIDLAFYGKQGRLEYDFDVNSGADPRNIELDFKGANNVTIAANGDLVLSLDGRELRFESPHVYQNSERGVQTIAGAFVLRGDHRAGFEIGSYDRSRTLVIDPVLAFSTYLGGSGDESCSAVTGLAFVPHCPAIAVDSASQAYVAGVTTSPSTSAFSGATPFPVGPLGTANVFIARFNPISSSANSLNYVTYLGGTATQYPAGVAVDSGFNVYVAGTTSSSDFPTTASAYQTAPASTGTHVFVSKLDSSGQILQYSTYLSGSGTDLASALALDSLGRAYVIGITTSSDLQTTPGALQPAPAAANQFFFSKVDPSLSGTNSRAYLTYIGGSTPSNGIVMGGAVAVDSSSNVYLAGGTNFTDMPTLNAYQTANQGGFDVWATRLNAPANNTQQFTPQFETYFGGTGDDIAYGIATDPSSTANTYITGSTTSTNIVTIPTNTVTGTTPFPRPSGGGKDAFIAKFGALLTTGTNSGKVPLNYFTYLGGGGTDVGLAIVADSSQNARVTGWTDSGDFPATASNPIQGGLAGGKDAFYAQILTTGVSSATSGLATYLGGSGNDIGTSLALDSALNTYLTGETSSGTFPTPAHPPVDPPLPPNPSQPYGPSDAFVSQLGPSVVLSMNTPAVNPTPVGIGNQVKFTYSIFNNGDPVSGAVFTDSFAANSSSVTASSTPGTCGSSSGTTLICNLGTIPSSTSTTTAAATVTVTVNVAVPSSTGVIPPQPAPIGNSGTLTVTGSNFPPKTATGTATVNDFGVTASPASANVLAGAGATYSVQVTPTGAGFPESVSLACGSGLPSGAACSFINNPIPNMSGGAQSRSFQITTTARVTTPASLFQQSGPTYAIWLPIFGVGLMGAGISRKRRMLLGAFIAALLGVALLQAGCGSSSSTTRTTTGTPAGTYTVTINATSGSATRTTTVQLTVQ
jgi:hypothetical protein